MKRITSLLVGLAFICFTAIGQDVQVSGKVTNADDGTVLPGVSVVVKGTTIGTTTNIDGVYTIEAPSDATLVFSFIGMLTEEVPVGGQTTIDLPMAMDVTGLEEVVVIGYGTRKKGALTGSIGLVKAEDIAETPIESFDQALQGKSTGVQVVNASGRPGSSAIVRIRGINTINATTDPLYIIDGVQVAAANFSALNPNDIESISVLKDATASIYGARGGNGVILVTTKKGNKGTMKINFSLNTGWSDYTKMDLNMMNAEEKLQYEIDNGYRYGDAATPEVVDSLLAQGHNWFETLSRIGRQNRYELSLSGGSEKTTYFISGQILDNEGLVDASYFNRKAGRVNVSHRQSDKLDFGVNSSIGYYDRGELRDRRNVQNPFYAMQIYNPYEPLKNPDGSWNMTHSGFNVQEALHNNPETIQQVKTVASFYLNWEFVKGLKFSTLAGFDWSDVTRQTFTKPSSILAGYVGDGMTNSHDRVFRQNYNNFLTYSNNFGSHSIEVKAGMEALKFWNRDLALQVQGFPGDDLAVPDAAAEYVGGGGNIQEWGAVGFFGAVNYGFNDKYIVDGVIRRDASSRFGANHQWATFGAIGGAWNMHMEDFMSGIPYLDELKLRASYGTMGNYAYNGSLYENQGTYGFGSYNLLSASVPVRIENADLKWETTATLDVGFNYAFFDRKLRGEFSYFNKNTSDLFFPVQISRTSGFTTIVSNVGSMVNRGIEFSVEYDVIRTGDFLWNIGGNITTLNNEITELYGEEGQQIESGFGILKKGYSAYQFYLVRYAGVNPANGDALFYDVDGNITNVYSDADRVIMDKSPLPKFYGSINTRVEYKGFDLSAQFYYNYGNHVFSYFIYSNESDGTNIKDNQSREMLRAWKKPGDITDIPETRLGNDRAWQTDRNLENGSFVRLRDLTLAYTLPKNISERARLDKVRVYVKGTNLLTWADYKGFDPEIGFNSSESAGSPVGSFDENTYPTMKTINIGIDIGF